jgi:hypothetical protein
LVGGYVGIPARYPRADASVLRTSPLYVTTARSTKRIDDAERAIEHDPIPDIFGPEFVATGVQSRGGDHGIVGRQSIALCERECYFVNIDRERLRRNRPRIIDRNVRVSAHDMPILRRATLAISFSTCTLIMPPAPISFSARSALAESPDATPNNTFVPRKLPGIRLFPVELEVGGKAPAKSSQALQQLLTPWLTRHAELTLVGNMDLDLVAFFQFERVDDRGGKANRQTVVPSRDLYGFLLI